MPVQPDYLAKMAQCEMAARFAPAGVADVWRSAADCFLLLADLSQGAATEGESIVPHDDATRDVAALKAMPDILPERPLSRPKSKARSMS